MKQETGRLAGAAALLFVAAATAQADGIAVFDTGVDASGNVLAPGVSDPHWSIVAVPSDAGVSVPRSATVAVADAAYVQNDAVGSAGSSWIAVNGSADGFYAPGDYVYRTTFDLTGFDPATAHLSATFGADDTVADILLNGQSTGIWGGTFWTLVGISLDAGFQDGVNTLDFVVENGGGSGSSSGFRAVLSGAADPKVVADHVPPAIVGATDHSFPWTGSPLALTPALLGITAADAVDGAVAVTLSPSSAGLGNTVVTASASDKSGNSASVTFTIHVLDVTPPVISGPALALPTFEWQGSPIALTAAKLGLSATDDVSGAVAVCVTPASVGLGSTVVTAKAVDAAGNAATKQFTVRVADTVAPAFKSISVTTSSSNGCDHKAVTATVHAVVFDAGDPAPSVKIVSVVTTCGSSKISDDWTITGPLTLQLRSDRADHADGRTYVITVKATDASGNSSTATVNLVVGHGDDGHGDCGGDGHDGHDGGDGSCRHDD